MRVHSVQMARKYLSFYFDRKGERKIKIRYFISKGIVFVPKEFDVHNVIFLYN